MKTPLILAAAAAITLSSALFAQSSMNTETPAAQSSNQSSKSNDQNHEDREFVQDASSGNNMEIQLGQYIADHSQNAQTKQFAQTLIRDHQQSQQQLKKAAEQAGIQVSEDLTPVHQAMLKAIQQKSGQELDRDFAFSAIADHHKDILEYTYAMQHLQNPQLKQYASVALPTLKQHLTAANALAQAVAGIQDTSATASDR